ncbi:MAG: divalent-cation tolerance protein CutA [Pseudomonadota bacterium]
MIIAITVNCPTEEIADAIAEDLVTRRLVAAANRYPEIRSRYVWQGKLETASEFPLILKTRRDLFDAVAEAVRELHPYVTPSIVATEIVEANAEYARWVSDNT